VHDGVWQRPIDAAFIPNTPFPDVQRAMAQAAMPSNDWLPTPFTPLVIETAGKRVLIDTGTGGQIAPTANAFAANLAGAGIAASTIDIVLVSHFHPDHINGIKTKDNARVFPHAEIKVPAAEWDFWMDDANLRAAPAAMKVYFLNARRIFADMAREVTRFTEGEIAPGLVALAAPGHTPGHAVFTASSGRETMLVLSDTTNHPAVFARHPEWQPVIDMDGPQAVAMRRKLLDRAAADRMLVHGYHFPFPACGAIVREGNGYAFVPA
jgi:glyoxylase-like metal-dependent hydrolase (beta-lactamase superfamily II)